MPENKQILIIDGQGGKIGRQLVEGILSVMPDADITAVGTNTAATSNMLGGGAGKAATGENAVIVACRRADIIAGPVGMVIADSLLGEITPAMAAAVGQSEAKKVLLPLGGRCNTVVVGASELSFADVIAKAVEVIRKSVSSA